MDTQHGASLVVKAAKVILRVLAVLFIGIVSAVIGFIASSNIFAVFGLEFYGREGYEAGGPIGFVLGALTGLVIGGLRLFARRSQ